jgi:hypothetical protein
MQPESRRNRRLSVVFGKPGHGLIFFIGCAEKAGHAMSFLSAFFVFAAPKFARLKELSYICSRK